MIIEIDSTIIDYMIKNTATISSFDEVIVSVNSLIKSFALKQHVIFADLEILEYLSESKFIDDFNKSALLWLIQKYSTIGTFVHNIELSTVAYKKECSKGIYYSNGKFFVPIEKFISVNCTQLLAENDKDMEFFIDIANEVNNKVLNYGNIGLEYDGRAYSGGNIDTVANEVTRKFNISLCIVDSDKDYYYDDEGSTLSKAREVVRKLRKDNVIELFSLKVREKENLIPPIFYLKRLNYSKELFVLLNSRIENEELIRFIDIKDGIKSKKYNTNNGMWHKLYDDFLLECEQNNILKCKLDELKLKEGDYVFLRGINAKAVEKVAYYFFHGGADARLKKMQKISTISKGKLDIQREDMNLSKNIFESLPTYLANDWIEIGKVIFQWCCRIADEEMAVFS